ncbi:MAG: toxin-antitoxin system YwqK family antitoxin [Marinilabiliaceae bacterium]|nr:toxin-antitoxin system YwqK family antitoxin [Marinilabiliaceae bacterium]
MRQILFFILLVLYPFFSFSQLIIKEDGKYYTKNGELYSGTYVEYFASGVKRIETSLLQGQKHGKTIIYFENEVISEIRSYKYDLMDGTWLTFNDKSLKIGEANYKDGLKHGKWYIWDNNGVKRYEMEYKDGEKTGTWSIWNEKGIIVDEKKYN